MSSHVSEAAERVAPAQEPGIAALPAGAHLLTLVAPSPQELEAGAQPSAAFAAATDVDRDHLLDALGNDDLLGNPETRLRGYTDRASVHHQIVLVARGPVTDRLVAAARQTGAVAASGDVELPVPAAAASGDAELPAPAAAASGDAELSAPAAAASGDEEVRVPAAAASGRAELRVPAAVVPGDEDRTPPADEVVAYGEASFDQLDNTSSCALEVFVRPAHRGKGLGRFLADRLTDIAREAGRTTVQTWADHASPGDGLEPLAPSTGAGAIGLDRSARFARARGMGLEQVERHSVLQVDGWPERWREALDEALTHTLPTDEVLTFEGPTPEEELEHIAELMRRMSTDIPLGGLDWEEEVWDADRVRRADANNLSSGHRRQLRTVVRDMTTGALVAHSILVVPVGRPVAWQGDTLVMKEHRGRRLGTIVKLANQLALLEQFPGTERIHTWNAVENSHMLDVNHAMGFELVALEGAWQGRIG